LDPDEAFTGFDAAEIAEIFGSSGGPQAQDAEPGVNQAEELRAKWGVELGQVWRLPSRAGGAEHVIACGDCTDGAIVAAVMGGGGRASLQLTDPPYGVGRDKGFGVGGNSGFAAKAKRIPRRRYDDEWDAERPASLDHVLSGAETAIIWGGNHFTDILSRADHWLVWDKHNTMPDYGDCELAWTNVKRKSVKKYDVEWTGLIGRESARYHPTQKPAKLFELILGDYSELGGVVADFYLGSGTTLIAAENTGRRCRGVEVSPGYVAVALERYEKAFGIVGQVG
jgi:site-specific DNA-methyltransferase (adenine-specific)